MKKVEDLFFVDVFLEAKVLAGHGGLKRNVESIEISETPDVLQFLDKNALLVTTGYAYKDNPAALADLVTQINDHPCAGIAIKLKRYIDEIPQEVLDLANSLEFPIIQIPESLTLGTVAHQLLSFIWDNQIQELFYAIHVHKKFTNMMIKGYQPQALIENLGTLLKSPVLLLDPMGEAISFTSQFHDMEMEVILNDVENLVQSNIEMYRKTNNLSLDIKSEINKEVTIKIFHMKTMHPYPYLLIIFNPNDLPYPSSQLAIEQASTVISFTLLKNEAIKENTRMLENNFFTSLVDGNISSQQEIIHRGEQHGLINNLKYICIVCKIDGDNHSTDILELLYDYLSKYLGKSVLNTDTENIIFMKDEYLVILMQFPKSTSDPIKSLLEEKLESFQNKVYTKLNISISFGGGNLFNDVTSIPITYTEAVDAFKQGAELFKYKFINFYVPKQLEELIRLIPEENLLKFYENTLLTLSYPKNGEEEDLVNTLIVYLDNSCHIAITSRKLYVHRNTVKYRISKCEEILGHSIQDAQKSLHLRMALLMRDMFV